MERETDRRSGRVTQSTTKDYIKHEMSPIHVVTTLNCASVAFASECFVFRLFVKR